MLNEQFRLLNLKSYSVLQLLKQERDKLKVKVQNSLYVVQERQAKVRKSFSGLYVWVSSEG
jgi:hypothetical protein